MIMANSKYQQTILVIEDDIRHDGGLSMILATRGYKVLTAKSGQDALAKSNFPIDLIILDLMLPDMDGIEVCHYLKQGEATRDIPVIVLSGRQCHTDEKVRCFQLGADDFLCKPFENEELIARIFALLRRNHKEGEREEGQRFEQVKQLREIIDHRLIEPNFQPLYLVDSTCQLFGLEVLSRPKVEGVFKNPEVLFSTALELGFYYELEMMVWQKALEALKNRAPCQNIFLNCSPYLIENNNFPQVRALFEAAGVSPKNIFFELTERSAISRHHLFAERLQEFRDFGFKIAVDDIGSGYASLESIIATRPDVVKIDRHIVHGLTTDPYKRSIVKFIVSFCFDHHTIWVAEGVETASGFGIRKDLGVKVFQGYYFCKPTSNLDIGSFNHIAA